MRKNIKLELVAFVILSFVFAIVFFNANTTRIYANSNCRMLTGVTLDVGNRYYYVEDIKEYIDLVAASGNGYVQLHFTGDRNVGIECLALNQRPSEKYVWNQTEYYNPDTGYSFLTRAQIRELLGYARQKGVEIIPEIDMPGHMGGFEKLYAKKYGMNSTKEVFNPAYEGELLINNDEAISFAKSIYSEYAELFKECRYFHIGCDEFWSGNEKENAQYINTISSFLETKGFIVWAWNDLFTKANISQINKNIFVTYWSLDGDSENIQEVNERRKIRATFPELQKAQFKVLNYNSYYLYYTPSVSNTNKEDADYACNDARDNWNLLKWDSDRGAVASSYNNIVGGCISIWGEDSKGVENNQIFDQIDDLYRIVSQKCVTKDFVHFNTKITNPATFSQNGSKHEKCIICGKTKTTVIPRVNNVSLNKTRFVYSGKKQTPTCSIKNTANKRLIVNRDYSLSYSQGRKNVGTYSVIITLKGNYKGKKVLKYEIIPKSTSFTKTYGISKGIKLSWKRQKSVNGYQLQYSRSNSFKHAVTKRIKGEKMLKYTIKKLKAVTRYYVRIRTYKVVSGKTYYSKWSSSRKITTAKAN